MQNSETKRLFAQMSELNHKLNKIFSQMNELEAELDGLKLGKAKAVGEAVSAYYGVVADIPAVKPEHVNCRHSSPKKPASIPPLRLDSDVWVDRDGVAWHPRDMDDSYLLNVIIFLRQNVRRQRVDASMQVSSYYSTTDTNPPQYLLDDLWNGSNMEWLNRRRIYRLLCLEASLRGLLH